MHIVHHVEVRCLFDASFLLCFEFFVMFLFFIYYCYYYYYYYYYYYLVFAFVVSFFFCFEFCELFILLRLFAAIVNLQFYFNSSFLFCCDGRFVVTVSFL